MHGWHFTYGISEIVSAQIAYFCMFCVVQLNPLETSIVSKYVPTYIAIVSKYIPKVPSFGGGGQTKPGVSRRDRGQHPKNTLSCVGGVVAVKQHTGRRQARTVPLHPNAVLGAADGKRHGHPLSMTHLLAATRGDAVELLRQTVSEKTCRKPSSFAGPVTSSTWRKPDIHSLPNLPHDRRAWASVEPARAHAG